MTVCTHVYLFSFAELTQRLGLSAKTLNRREASAQTTWSASSVQTVSVLTEVRAVLLYNQYSTTLVSDW